MTRVLALDLATTCGWACGSTEGTPVSHGICKMPKTGADIGRYLAHFRDWLRYAIDEMEPDEIVFEAPILTGLETNITTLRKLYSLAGVTELVAHESLSNREGSASGIPITEANLAQIRKHFIGTSKAPADIKDARVRRLWLKQKTIEECRRRGFRVSGDDDADAIALLSLRLSQLCKDYSLKATPLFAQPAEVAA